VKRVLVVANETVEAQELLAELRRIEALGDAQFHVLSPAVPVQHGLGTWNQGGAIQAAEERLERTLAILRAEGFEADGHVGDMLPIPAIEDTLLTFPADTIVISTHPESRSNWLRRDVVGKARRKFKPRQIIHVVSHVTEHDPSVRPTHA
jgi:GABA permease